MNWIDYCMLGFMVAFLVYGFSRGFVRQVVGITCVVGALLLAAWYAPDLAGARFLDGLRAQNAQLPTMAAYLIIFVTASVASGVILTLIAGRRPSGELRKTDSFLGAVLGALEGVLLLGGVSIGLLEWDDPVSAPVKRSILAPRLAEGCRAIVLLIPEEGREGIREGYQQGTSALKEAFPVPPSEPGLHADPPPRRDDDAAPAPAPEPHVEDAGPRH